MGRNRCECSQEISRERKNKFHAVQVGFHCSLSPLRISSFFAFIILEIRTQHKKNCKEYFRMYVEKFSWKKKKNLCCRSGIPLLLSSLSNFEIFLHSLFWKYEHSIKKNCKDFFWMYLEKFSWKKKKNPCCRSWFPLLLVSPSNFEFFVHSSIY